ncbi:hypothetical protein [Yoonia sp. MH D7]
MQRRSFILGAPLALTACGAASGTQVWAQQDAVDAAIYRGTGPKSLTLLTMLNVGSDNGAHSALLVDASQRVLFDPAGSFQSPTIPERNDVLFGISPNIEQYYISYHARASYYVQAHKIEVSPEVAEKALQLVLANGPVAQMACTRATSLILRQLAGFETLRTTYFPDKLRDRFAALPGVTMREFRENDADNNAAAAAEINAALTADQ